MICIKCFHDKTNVINSRGHKKHPSVWRRRSCPKCSAIFTTYESPSLDNKEIIDHKTKKLTNFNIGKLIISIARSFHHNQYAASNESFYLAQTIQQKLMLKASQLSSKDIASVTHDTLKKYDSLAARQYAAQHNL